MVGRSCQGDGEVAVPDLYLGKEGFGGDWGIWIQDRGGAVVVGGGLVRLLDVPTKVSSLDWRWRVLLYLWEEAPV